MQGRSYMPLPVPQKRTKFNFALRQVIKQNQVYLFILFLQKNKAKDEAGFTFNFTLHIIADSGEQHATNRSRTPMEQRQPYFKSQLRNCTPSSLQKVIYTYTYSLHNIGIRRE